MARRLAFALALFFAIASPGCKKPPEQPPALVSPQSLVRAFRDTPITAERAYRGCKVRITLAPHAYTVAAGRVLWPVVESGPAVIVFTCHEPPKDAKSALEIVGVCRGATHDGIRRGGDIDFSIAVDECVVTPR